MKTQRILTTAAALAGAWVATTSVSHARGADAPREAMVTANNLSRLRVGGGAERLARELQGTDGSGAATVDARNYFGYAGLDLLRWLTVFGGGGQVEAKVGGAEASYGDSDTSWMVGGTATLLAHPITEPGYLAGTLRIDAQYLHWDFEAGMGDGTLQWTEDRVAVIASVEFPVFHAIDDSENVPYSSVLSIGPVYSAIDGDAPGGRSGGRTELEEVDTMGLLAGFDMKFAANWSAGWQGRWIGDEVSHTFTAAFHF